MSYTSSNRTLSHPTSPLLSCQNANLTSLARVHRCDQYCPNNILSTIDQIVQGLVDDITTAIRITFKCMGASNDQIQNNKNLLIRPGICVCQLVKILAPEWRKQAKKDPNANKELLCTGGDPLGTITNKVFGAIGDELQKAAEEVGNTIIDATEDFFSAIVNFFSPGSPPVKLAPNECITTLQNVIEPQNRRKHCGSSFAAAYEKAIQFQCEKDFPKWKRCYYERVREICQKDDYIKRYYALFDGGFQSVSAFQADLSDIFGEAWEDDPSLGSIVSAAVRDIETPRNLDGRKNICSGDTLLKSLPLDQMIIRRAHA